MIVQNAVRFSKNADFHGRVLYFMIKAAIAILNDAPDAADIILGQRILDNGEPVETWALAVMGNAGIMAGAYIEEFDILDETLEPVVNGVWGAFKL